MKRIFLIFLLIITQKLFSQSNEKIENISRNTSELLLKKENIDNYKYAIKIKSLYPNEDFSKFKDSPAEAVLGMLHQSELELPKIWNELVKKIIEYKTDKTAKYFTTYYHKMGVDNYIVTSVIKTDSKYFAFSYNLLEWGKDIYISRFYKEIKEFENIEEIEANPFTIIQEEMQNELNENNNNDSEEIIINPKN